MNKNNIKFRSKYVASVFDIKIVDEKKDNKHTCGIYTMNILSQVSKYSMRSSTKSIFTPVLFKYIEKLKAMEITVNKNNELIDLLFTDAAMNKDDLLALAIKTNTGEKFPCDYESNFNVLPSTIMLSHVFNILDEQCLSVDALVRTGWLEASKGNTLHKRLVKPLRTFMQETAQDFKSHRKSPVAIEEK